MYKRMTALLMAALLCLGMISCGKKAQTTAPQAVDADYSITYIEYDKAGSSGCPVQDIYRKNAAVVYGSDEKKSFAENLTALIAKKPGTVMCFDGDSKSDILSAAENNKDIRFVMQNLDLTEIPENVLCVNIDVFTAAFAVGNLAGYASKNAHTAFVADRKTSVSSRICDGFTAGAEFASQGVSDSYFADNGKRDVLTLAKEAADGGCDVIFVYSTSGFDDIKKELAGRNVSIVAVGQPVDETVICSLTLDMKKIYSDISAKTDAGACGTRVTYGFDYIEIVLSDSSVLTETVRSYYEQLFSDLTSGVIFIPEKKNDGQSEFDFYG